MTTMNSDVKTAWVAALRSKDYVQGRRRLRTEVDSVVEYCCLGVLCDLYAKTQRDGDQLWSGPLFDGESTTSLTSRVKAWAGLGVHDNDPYVVTGRLTVNDEPVSEQLTHLNDGGSTFPEIADLIEKSL
jgi:hypothetical protein